MPPFILDGFFPVSATKPVTTNGGVTCDYISVKNAVAVSIVVHMTQTVGHATAVAPKRATAVAGTGVAALGTAVPIRYGNVTTSTNALAVQTAAVSFTLDVGVTGDVYVIFDIDPATLGSTYDVLGLAIADSSQGTNFVEATYWIKPRYAQTVDNNISYIVD